MVHSAFRVSPSLSLGHTGATLPLARGMVVGLDQPVAPMSETASVAVRVWDLPTRLFHWTLAVAMVGAVVTAKIGGNAMVWHFRLGYLIATLVIFRLLWGLVGGRWSRFASFIHGPRTVWRYLRGQVQPGEALEVGHNPLGALSVFALLGFIAVQVGTGLVADDEIANIGPLNRFVSTEAGLEATSWHKEYGQWILIALVVLHVAAIVVHRVVKRHDLVGPMWRGDKLLPPGTPGSADGVGQRVMALVLALACGALMAWVSALGR